ncbi:MAG: VCBS repeat-containing protein [Rhodothermales bacterium]
MQTTALKATTNHTYPMRRSLTALVLGLAFLTACSGPQSATRTGSVEGTIFIREVTPFPILDRDGNPFQHPFLGGFNIPRPQFSDMDADGDEDLFVQERAGKIMYFERADNGLYEWRTDTYGGINIHEWYRFYDIDGDGDKDLFAEQPYSYIAVYKNIGTAQQAEFELVQDTLRDVRGNPLFSDRQNILNFTDLDCDGNLDLFIGRIEGTIMHYESVGLDDDGVPMFRLEENQFEGIEIIGEDALRGSLHGANTLMFADYDQDGDQDLFFGDYFEQGLLLIENRGSCQRPSLRTEPRRFPPNAPVKTSGYNAPALSDIDQDGKLDLLVGVLGGAFNPNRTSDANMLYYHQETPENFTLRTKTFVGDLDIGNETIAAAADLDGDGDLDITLANKIAPYDVKAGRMIYIENTGTAIAPSFAVRDTMNLEPAFHYAPAFYDLDDDGDLDMLAGRWNKGMIYYRNDGTAQAHRFMVADDRFVELTRGSNATPALGDLDGDGDADLMVGESSGTINYYRNDGTKQEPSFTLVSDEFMDIDVGRRSAPTLVDYDADGDLDLLIGSESEGVQVYRNDGNRKSPEFVLADLLPIDPPLLSAPVLVDLDGDGDLDYLSGSQGGGIVFYRAQ